MDSSNGERERLEALLKKHSSNKYVASLNIRVANSAHDEVVQSMQQYGNRVLFLTGNRAMRNKGFLKLYQDLFARHGFEVALYDNISSNPTLKQMNDGLAIARDFKPEFIFALGGGSVIDTAKVLSATISGGDVWAYVEKKAEIKEAVPIVASATTSGTGSHITPYAVITNTDTLEKKTLKHELLLPKLSVTDVDITQHMPRSITASTGFDVLCHAAEVYTRSDCTEQAREFATRALELVREHLVASYESDSLPSKVGMIYADIYAGIALSLIGTHVPHAISHPISARFPNVNHGVSLAYVMAETAKKQIEKGKEELNTRYIEVSRLLGGGNDFVRTIKNYIKLLDLGKAVKYERDDCEKIYLDTIGYRMSSVERSPVRLSEMDVREIIHNSLAK